MREMTISKTPWISEYPADWKQVPLHALFAEHKNKNKDGAEQNLLSLSYGSIIRKDINTNEGLLPESFNGYNIIEDGDIVLRLTDLQNDHRSLRTGLVTERGIITSAYVTLRKKAPLSSEYYHYLLHAFDIMKAFYTMGEGIRQSLGYDELAYVVIPQPSLPEQHAIVRYLDSKCAAIDEAIERHKKIIEKLEEYRKAEISQSVTRGMSAGVQTRPSGNRCTGDIPAHWGYCKILYVLAMPITDGPHETPTAVDEGIPFISAEAVSQGNGKIDFDHMWGYISQEFYEQCCKKYIPQKDDIFMIKSGATTGKVAIVDTDRVFTIWSPLAVLRVNKEKMTAKYLFYYVQSNSYQQQVELGWNYGTQQNIGMRMVERLKVCVPPLEEQGYITTHLDKVWDEVNASIEREITIIEKLEEYRKSIIYNAVTGKIDCR